MTVGLSDRAREIRRAALVAFGVVVTTFQLSGTLGLRINTSPVAPDGSVYRHRRRRREHGRVLPSGTVRDTRHYSGISRSWETAGTALRLC